MRLLCYFSIVAGLLFAFIFPAAMAAKPGLKAGGQQASAVQRTPLPEQGDRTVYVQEDISAEALLNHAPYLTIKLDGQNWPIQRIRSQERLGYFAWEGRILTPGLPHPEGWALFTVWNNRVSGKVVIGDRTFKISDRGDHRLLAEVNTSQVPEEVSCRHAGVADADTGNRFHDSVLHAEKSSGPGSVVRLLVPYTKIAMQDNNEILSDVVLNVEQANTAFINSQINLVIELITDDAQAGQFFEVDVDIPNGGLGDYVQAMITPVSDPMLQIAVWRDMYDADLVILVTHKGACGEAAVVGANADNAFAAMSQSGTCWDNYQLAHEIGHLLGAGHWIDNKGATDYAHGHKGGPHEDLFRTIMVSDSGGPKIQHFSNPDVNYMGEPTGTAGFSNNARVIREWAPLAQDFRPILSDYVSIPSGRNFGYQPQATTTSHSFQVTHQEAVTQSLTMAIEGSSDFTIQGGATSITFGPNQTKTITVDFSPSDSGPRFASLKLKLGNQEALSLWLSGGGEGTLGPDLVIENLTIPVQAAPGDAVDVDYLVKNVGDQVVHNSYRERIYLSPDGTLGSAVILTTTPLIIHDMDPNAVLFRDLQVTIPIGTQAGNYTLLVEADTNNYVAEFDETNNLAQDNLQVGGSTATGKDLVIENLGINFISSYDNAYITYELVNQGTVTVTEDTLARVYLCTTADLATGTVLASGNATFHMNDLVPGARQNGSGALDLSSVPNTGHFYFIIQADAYDVCHEDDETNNETASNSVFIH